jgi:hypothetical protein
MRLVERRQGNEPYFLSGYPDIRAAQARYLAMQEHLIQKGTLPDPTLGVLYHNEDWEATFGISR